MKQFDILTDSVCRLAEQAEKFGVFAAVEPVHVHTMNSPELTYELIRRVASPNLKIIYDPVTVSYTHLDVYKRQPSMVLMALCERPTTWPSSFWLMPFSWRSCRTLSPNKTSSVTRFPP